MCVYVNVFVQGCVRLSFIYVVMCLRLWKCVLYDYVYVYTSTYTFVHLSLHECMCIRVDGCKFVQEYMCVRTPVYV